MAVAIACALLLSGCSPRRPVNDERRYRAELEAALGEAIGPEYSLETSATPLAYDEHLIGDFMPAPGWYSNLTVTARSVSHPAFAVYMDYRYESGAGYPASVGAEQLAMDTHWKRTLDGMPEDRRQSFLAWWPEHAAHDEVLQGIKRLGNLVPMSDFGGVRPQSVSPEDIYNATYTMTEETGLAFASDCVGWDEAANGWVELEW
jgi:hypothetical protein